VAPRAGAELTHAAGARADPLTRSAPVGTRTRTRPDESGLPGRITAEGYRRLEAEAAKLWTRERPAMARAVAVAAAEGDRSENAEYQYSKRKLAEIDRRLRFLGARLEVLSVVEGPPPEDGRVHFGSWVTLEDQTGAEVTYRIVGPDETDAAAGWISEESPVGKALEGRKEGDEVTVRRPKGEATYLVLRISSEGIGEAR
jgi:transcription elongation factor GreB